MGENFRMQIRFSFFSSSLMLGKKCKFFLMQTQKDMKIVGLFNLMMQRRGNLFGNENYVGKKSGATFCC
jgi:hypothetical protein